jgi:hypothetical protein
MNARYDVCIVAENIAWGFPRSEQTITKAARLKPESGDS